MCKALLRASDKRAFSSDSDFIIEDVRRVNGDGPRQNLADAAAVLLVIKIKAGMFISSRAI